MPSLDAMRGLIIALMAIDHARAFISKSHPGEFWGRALPAYPDAVAFLTRLVTHLCAPGFLFLMGVGMTMLAASRTRMGWSNARIVRYFATRGLALVLLGQVLENGSALFGLVLPGARLEDYGGVPPGFDGTPPYLVFPVLYGLGAAMILSACFVRLPPPGLWICAAAGVLVTHWITPPALQVDVPVNPVMRLLFVPGQTGHLLVIYSAAGWLPPALLGFAFGRRMLEDRRRAFDRLAAAGAVFLAAFVLLRAAGGFGNLHPREAGWIGFLNLTKYPPDLTFLLFALGIDFLLLAGIERARIGERTWSRPLLVYGAVPFFFFVAHMWLYAAMGRLFPMGLPIPQMYPFWLLGLVLLYWPCRWYGDFKRRKPAESFVRML